MTGRQRTRFVTGLHLVRKRLAHGLDRWFIYAWRGGPCIHKTDGARPVIGPEIMALASEARRGNRRGDNIENLIEAFTASPEYTGLGTKTKRDYRLWLDRITDRFGDAPLAAFEAIEMRGVILDWRDGWAHQPRTADKATGTLATLLAWAANRGSLRYNPAASIAKLHKADRSDMVWEASHWEAFNDAPAPLLRAMRLAALTGLRLGDLVLLDWSHVGDHSIIVTTAKREVRAVIPLYADLRDLLGDRGDGRVLLSSKGTGWSEDGLKTAFQRAKPKGFERRFHDLRGTFVTGLCLRGFTDEEIARIIGWSAKRVAEVRSVYVSDARVVIALAERMSA